MQALTAWARLCTGSWLPAHVMYLRGHADISRGEEKKKEKRKNTQRPTGSFEVPEPEKESKRDRHPHSAEESNRAGGKSYRGRERM